MSQPRLLNLDDLTPSDIKAVTLNGRKHLARDLTVSSYLERVKKSRLEKPEDTVESRVEMAVEMLRDLFPSMTDEDLRALELFKLNALLDFALKAPEDIAKATEEQQSGNA